MKKMLLTVASALLLSNTVMAAEVVPVASVANLEGSAVVSRGDASIALKNNMVLLEGDKVAILEKSTLQLTYADCLVSHQQNTVVDVSANAPCAVGQQFGVGAAEVTAGAGSASGTGAAVAGSTVAGATAVVGGVTAGTLIAAGLGIAALAAAATSDNDSSSP
ncbi:hypothetical protein [Thiothrix sp.]|uniref:hypothetical protein n=1 Tax=Thiothrix sp. TaxID=1032 RepID=UPI00257D5CA1|nr:hypothetical protein [Thiothrix sp.]